MASAWAITSTVAHQVASEARERAETGEPPRKQKPAKLIVLQASAGDFSPLRHRQVTPQGLEPQLTVPETVVLPLHHGVVFSYREPGWALAVGMYQSILIM